MHLTDEYLPLFRPKYINGISNMARLWTKTTNRKSILRHHRHALLLSVLCYSRLGHLPKEFSGKDLYDYRDSVYVPEVEHISVS